MDDTDTAMNHEPDILHFGRLQSRKTRVYRQLTNSVAVLETFLIM